MKWSTVNAHPCVSLSQAQVQLGRANIPQVIILGNGSADRNPRTGANSIQDGIEQFSADIVEEHVLKVDHLVGSSGDADDPSALDSGEL
ncbi:MAG: hypothetical protein E2O54_05410 [Gammaproteobacteria bacterium]|nr:MAG: hypothetical protein E2O54_05410 [Gammaproteobacteria bacterium]